jgi:hypothetical protein
MRIIAFWYGSDESIYARLAKVLEYSAKRFHSRVDIVRGEELPANRSEAFKLKARDWTRAIARADEPIALLDCDTYVRASLAPAFDRDYDIAVTRDEKGRLNSGVLFVRPSPKVASFFAPWEEHTKEWCTRNTPDRISFGDQDALEAMIQRAPGDLHITNVPMRIWNSTQRTWPRGIECARVVHVKSDARKHIEKGTALTTLGAQAVVNEWLSLEKECSQ